MPHGYPRELSLFLALTLAALAADARAATGRSIRVRLFGQPCLLQGPTRGTIDERALKAIHALSPEQLYPERENTLTGASTRRALEKLRAANGIPSGLDRYRERLGKRLEAQLALLEAIEKARKDGKAAPLLATAKANLKGTKLTEFEAAAKKAEAAHTLAKADTQDTLFDLYSDGIEPDPEEEFHRAIQRMGVQYACSFESTGGGADEAGAGGESK
jgi:hypothetical protein